MLATSDGLTVVSFFSLRMRPEALRPVKWRLAVWPRRILPPAVILKRLRAPRCVFNFIFGFEAFLGISKTFLESQKRTASERRPYKFCKAPKFGCQLGRGSAALSQTLHKIPDNVEQSVTASAARFVPQFARCLRLFWVPAGPRE